MKHAYADLSCGQIYYEEAGSGEPVICLHQTIWSTWEYQRLIPLLAKKFHVIAVDTMGFGRSDPAPVGWSVDDYGNSIFELMDKLGIKKAHFVGQHTGAFVATGMAAKHGDRMNKIALSGAGLFNLDFVPFTPDPTGLWAVSTMTQNVRERIANRSLPMPDLTTRTGSHLIGFWANQLHENPKAPMEDIQKAFIALVEHFEKRGGGPFGALLKFDMEAAAKQVKNKCILMIGTKDCFYPPVTLEPEVIAHIIPDCKIAYVEDAGIMGFYSHADQFAKHIIKFLQEK